MTEIKKKILIGEDEKAIAKAMELKLNFSGYDAKAVFDGKAVLEEVEKEKYDLLLLDIIMPKIDGFGVLEELAKKGVKIPIVMLSNLSQEEDEKKARALGACGYFIKSNTPLSTIVEHIKEILK
jgi:DNA-binding response OmpR family regulator